MDENTNPEPEDPRFDSPQNIIIIYSSETFKQQGFYVSIQEDTNPQALAALVAENKSHLEDKKSDINKRFQRRIDWLEEQLTGLKESLNTAKANTEALIRLDDIRQRLLKICIDFGAEKRSLIERRLDEFSKEIKKLFDSENTLYDDWRKLNEKMFRDNKPRLDVIRNRADQLRNQYNGRSEDVNAQIRIMDGGGMDPSAHQYLLGKGMALVAGWFFSVYLVSLNKFPGTSSDAFGQDDVWFFLLKSVMMTLSENPWIAVFQILFTIFLIGGVSWLSQFILQKLGTDKNTQNFAFNVANEEVSQNEDAVNQLEKRFRFSVTSSSMYALFLHTMPVLLVLGFVFIILRLGVAVAGQNMIEYLDSSIEGQVIGTATAFAVGGILLLFFSKIKDISFFSWLNRLLIISTLLFPFLFALPVTQPQRALLGFVYAISISGVAMAFGIRYRGLRRISDELNVAIGVCSQVIAQYSSPIPVGIHTNDFRLKVKLIQGDLLDWINGKNTGVRNMQDVHVTSSKEQKETSMFNRLKNWFSRRGDRVQPTVNDERRTENNIVTIPLEANKQEKYAPFDLDGFERQNFPDYDKQLLAIKFEYDEAKALDRTNNELISTLENQILEINQHIFDLQRSQSSAIQDAIIRYQNQENWIREGFELGDWVWHVKNDPLLKRGSPPTSPTIINLPIVPPLEPEEKDPGEPEDPNAEDPIDEG